jgi:hypothetical protein
MPVQVFPIITPHRSGTVKVHTLEYNTTAKRGTWNVYQLIQIGTENIIVWFSCHSEVNPEEEIKKNSSRLGLSLRARPWQLYQQ